MNLQEIWHAYGRLPRDHGLPEMWLEQALIQPINIPADPMYPTEGAARLAREIADFAPAAGWLCYQSAVVSFDDGQYPEPNGQHGLVLSGELASAPGASCRSLHIRPDGRGGWRLVQFTPDQGDTYLTDAHKLVVHDGDPKRRQRPRYLHYLRYWTLDPHHGVRQTAARFIGFEGVN
jgi:hypothetical protein